MFTPEISFLLAIASASTFAAWFARRNGKETALGSAMAISFLAATWFDFDGLGYPINVPVATAIIWLIVYCSHSWREIFSHLCGIDYLLGCLMVWQIFVDSYYSGRPLAVAALAYGQWMLPYAAGRYAFLKPGTLQKVGPLFVIVGGLIGVAATIEAPTGLNVWEAVFTGIDDKVQLPVYSRFGLSRAHGPARHPIFLGVMLLTMIPFAIEWLTRNGVTPRARVGAAIGLAAIIAGILATISRGPILCLPLVAAISLAWYSRRARIGLTAIVGIIGTMAIYDSALILKWLESGTNQQQRSRIVVLEDSDKAEIYSGTRNRLLAPRIYGPIFLRGGLMGYGTEASSGFPPRNLPGIPRDPELLKRVSIIDNSYLNIGLAFGWVGFALFAGMLALAVISDFRNVRYTETFLHPADDAYFVARAAVLIGIMAQLCLVYWDFDHGFWIMSMIGVSASLTSCRQRHELGID